MNKKGQLYHYWKYYVFIVLIIAIIIIPGSIGETTEGERELGYSINYKNKNMIIEFKDKGNVVGKVVLKSHKTYDEIRKVTTGKNKTVMWYEFSDFKDIKKDALKGVEFIDMRKKIENKSYTKQFDGNLELMNESKIIIPNPNYLLSIEKDYTFVYLKEPEWIDYNSKEIPKENIIIGVQTDLFWGEFLDVRLNILGNKLDRHALVLGTNYGFVTTAPSDDPEGPQTSNVDQQAIAIRNTAPSENYKIIEIGWWSSNPTQESNFEVGLYSDAGNNEPEVLLEVNRINAKGTTAGWKKVVVDWEIDPSTIYWIAVQIDTTATRTQMDYNMNDGLGFARHAFDDTTLPADWGTSQWKDTNAKYAIYALIEELVPPDTCTYGGSGNWDVTCSDNCTISSPVVGDGSNLNIGTDAGTFNMNAKIEGFNIIHLDTNNCIITCQGAGNCFI